MKDMSCDVLVVGAGPAGSSAAYAAAAAGAKVIMIDRRRVIGVPAQCAGFVPAAAAAQTPACREAAIQKVTGMTTLLPDGRMFESPSPGFIVARDRFDQMLAREAEEAGVMVLTRTRAISHADGVTAISTLGGRLAVDSKVVIGADGPISTVGSWLGSSNTETARATQWRVPLKQPSDRLLILFHKRLSGGYGWLFPTGDTANVGIGLEPRAGAKPGQQLKWFVEKLAADGLIEPRPLKVTGGLIPVGGPVRCQAGNMLLAGDAAGLCHPVTGAGISTAIQSGRLAGEAAARYIQSGDPQALNEYEKEIQETYGESMKAALNRRNNLYSYMKDDEKFAHSILDSWMPANRTPALT